MSITEDKKLNLFLSKTDGLPIQAVSDEGTLYFSYPNDSILELVYDNGGEMIMQDSIPYSLNEMKDMVTSYKYEDNLQGILFYFTHLVEGHSSLPNINTIVEAFNKTLLLHIEISSNLTDLELRKMKVVSMSLLQKLQEPMKQPLKKYIPFLQYGQERQPLR